MIALFAHHFGIRPWEIDRLTAQEFLGLEAAARAMNAKESDG